MFYLHFLKVAKLIDINKLTKVICQSYLELYFYNWYFFCKTTAKLTFQQINKSNYNNENSHFTCKIT